MSKKAIILLSGGLDSTTVLAIAQAEGYECHTISFDYGQKHRIELEAAQQIAKNAQVKSHRVFNMNFLGDMGGSALTSDKLSVPVGVFENEIPITYVPARNILFLSIALSYAEVIGAYHIFIGANSVDYSNYPDCRPEFIRAFESMANLGTKAGVEHGIQIHSPLQLLKKFEIVQLGTTLKVNYALTISCYQPSSEGHACGTCPSCILRKKGFEEAHTPDPTRYI